VSTPSVTGTKTSKIPEQETAMKTIHAIYENGVFRPTEPVELPEGTEVQIPTSSDQSKLKIEPDAGLANVYAILGERYSSGFSDTAERHNEHQP
jgi:predicted DNA-binding antitoxin AbrB/MazE fold protein